MESKDPYITYADQYIRVEKWPDPGCKCKGQGHFGSLLPQGPSKKDPDFDIPVNSPCFCGSGKKYKKCCMFAIDRLRKNGYRIILCKCIGDHELAELCSNPALDQMKQNLDAKFKKPEILAKGNDIP